MGNPVLHYFLKVTLLICSLLMLVSSCNYNGNENRTVIGGKLPGFGKQSIYLSEIGTKGLIPLDSTVIKKDGSFKFTFRRSGPGFFLVKIDNGNYVTLILDEEKRVSIFADDKDLRRSYRVEGSPDSELYRQFEQFNEANRQIIDSLTKIFNEHQRSPGFQSIKAELDQQYELVFNQQRDYVIRFIEGHCESLASLLLINRRFGQRKVISEEMDLGYLMQIDSCLSARYPANMHLLEHKKKIKDYIEKKKKQELAESRLAIGNPAPDLRLETPAGNSTNLHSLKGRPIIIYFWSSRDDQSRKSNKKLKEFINKAGRDVLIIFAIGLENYREAWLQSIQEDELVQWVNVTDYMGMQSPARILYNVPDTLPFYFLIDRELIIRYKGMDINELESTFRSISAVRNK